MKLRSGFLLCGLTIFTGLGVGCRTQSRLNLAPHTGGSAFLYNQFQAFDGRSGRPLRFAEVVRRCRSADVVLFGEEHGDAVCCQLEAQLLLALINDGRPCALAMEFFEADVQDSLDAYLARRIGEPEFRRLTNRRSTYLKTHRPLIELCRAANVPVIAANAPRRLVTAYRESGDSYEDYRAGLPAEDRRWLPVENAYLTGDYCDRFAELMEGMRAPPSEPASQPTDDSPTSLPTMPPADMPSVAIPPTSQPDSAMTTQPASMPTSMPAAMPSSMPALPTWQELYAAQLLWDQTMSEALTHYRTRHERGRAMLVVGKFHVAHDGGLLQKFRRRRPADRVVTIVFASTPDTKFAFDDTDDGAGDIVIYGLTPPEPPREMPSMPIGKPMAPATQPVEAPASQPASAPVVQPNPEPESQPAETS